jgi:hypothetical protein
MMNRRGVLGMLGIGAAAGPAVVSQLGSQGSVHAIPSTAGWDNFSDKAEMVQWNPIEQLAEAKRDYEAITLDPEAWITDWASREWKEYMDGYTSIRYETIDADIRNMKSFSETAKMRMYFERKARRKQAQYAESAWGRVQEWMNKV